MTPNEIEVTIYRWEYNYIVAFDLWYDVMYKEMSLDVDSPNGVNMRTDDFYDTWEMEKISLDDITKLWFEWLSIAIERVKQDLAEDYNNQQ